MVTRAFFRRQPHTLLFLLRSHQYPPHLLHPKPRSFSRSSDHSFEIESRLQSPENNLDSIHHRDGFPQPDRLHGFISQNHILLNAGGRSEAEECFGILSSFGFPQEYLVSVMSSSPGVLKLGFLRKWQAGFAQLGFNSLPPVVIQKVLEQSIGTLSIEPGDLHYSLQALREAGFGDETLVRAMEELPCGLLVNYQHIISMARFFDSYGFRMVEIDRICHEFPRLFLFSIQGRLRPLFEEFGDLGFRGEEVRKTIVESPSLMLGMEVGELSRCMSLLRTLKCRLPIKERILDKSHLRAAIEVKLRVDCLSRHGLIRRDALSVIWREPRVIMYKLGEIEKKIGFLLHRLGFSIESLVDVPEFLGVNLENQIMPRHQVIESLRSKKALGFEVDLRQLVKFSRKKFYNMFVKPYPECEEIFGGLLREREVRAPPPTGLWKLFKPPKYPECDKEVVNTQSFMKSLV